MVLPGFLSGDWATKALRADLRRAGFRCYAWGLGFNRGATADIIERIDTRVQWIIDRTGYAPALVGWSLGGIYAREYAKSEEHTSELQSLMRISYAVFCLK